MLSFPLGADPKHSSLACRSPRAELTHPSSCSFQNESCWVDLPPLHFTDGFWHVFIIILPLKWFVGSRILPHAGWKAHVASALGKGQREGRGEHRWECLGAFWECRGTVPRAAQLQRYRERFASLRIKLFITKSNFIVNWFKVILQLCACISYFGKNGYFP